MNRISMISPRGVSDSSASGFDGSSSDFSHRRNLFPDGDVDEDSVDSFQHLLSKCCQLGSVDEDPTTTRRETLQKQSAEFAGPGKSQPTSLSAKVLALGNDEESDDSTAQPPPFDSVIRDELTLDEDGFQRNLSDIVTQTTASTLYKRDGLQCGVQAGEGGDDKAKSWSVHEKSASIVDPSSRASTPTKPISNTARIEECDVSDVSEDQINYSAEFSGAFGLIENDEGKNASGKRITREVSSKTSTSSELYESELKTLQTELQILEDQIHAKKIDRQLAIKEREIETLKSHRARLYEKIRSEKVETRRSTRKKIKDVVGDEDCPAEDPALEEYPESDDESEEGNGDVKRDAKQRVVGYPSELVGTNSISKQSVTANNECRQVDTVGKVFSRCRSNLSNSSNSIVLDDTRESQTIPVITPRADLVFSAAINDSLSASKEKGATSASPEVFQSDLFSSSKVLGSDEGESVEADHKGSSDDLTPASKKSTPGKKPKLSKLGLKRSLGLKKSRAVEAIKPKDAKDATFGRNDDSGLPESPSSQWSANSKRIRSVIGMKEGSKSKKDVVAIKSDDPKPKSRDKISTTPVAEIVHGPTEDVCNDAIRADGHAGAVGKNAVPSALSSRIGKPRFMRKASPKKVDKIPLLDVFMRTAVKRHNSDEPSVSSIEKLVNSMAIDVSSVTGEVEFASSKAKELFLCKLSPIRSAKDGLDPAKLEVRSGSCATESLSMTDESISLNVTGSSTPLSKRSVNILPATPPTPTRNGESWNITQSFLFGAACPPSPSASILGRLPLKRDNSVSETIECQLDNTYTGEEAVSVSVELMVTGHENDSSEKGSVENVELPQMPPPVNRKLEYDMDDIGFGESICRTPFQSRPIEIATSSRPPPRKLSARDEVEIGREFSSAKLSAFSIQSSFLRQSRCSVNDGKRKNKLSKAASKKPSLAGRGETCGGVENNNSNNESIEIPLGSAF